MKWYRLYKESNDDFVIDKWGALEKYNGPGGDVVIPDNVTSIGARTFKYCNELTSVRIPDNVKDIDEDAFYRCENLKSLIIGNGLKRIGIEAFNHCKNLETIKFGENLEKIGWASFANCTSLKSVTIPKNVKIIGRGAFAGCTNLTNVKILNPDIEIVAEAFSDCPLKIDPNDKILCKIFPFGIFGLEVTKYASSLGNPEYVRYNGGKEFHIRDLAGMISHQTIMRPLNDDWSGREDYSMLCKAQRANPELFKQTLIKLLSGNKIDSWWDDTNGKWETDEKTLKKKNKDREEWQRNADMMNGL